jgi:hypothetical protein
MSPAKTKIPYARCLAMTPEGAIVLRLPSAGFVAEYVHTGM